MKELIRKFLEYVNDPANRYSSGRNPVSIHMEDGRWIETSKSQVQSVVVHNGEFATLVSMGIFCEYMVDGVAYTPVEYVMNLLFGDKKGSI